MSLIQVSNLTFSYEGSFDTLFEHVSFQIDTNWKLGFIGRNGKGKTTFLRLLTGSYQYSGTIHASVDFSYFPYTVADPGAQTVELFEEVCPEAEYWHIKKELNLLEVSEDVLYRPFDTLSGGEQVKVMLAALFLKENQFLLIDEPTDHLDLAARKTVSRYLKRQSGFILVSHDRAFLDGCIDHVLSLNRSSIEVIKGNYSTWQENKQLRDNFELHENLKLKKEVRRLDQAAKQVQTWSDTAHRTAGKNAEVKMGFKEFGRKKAKKMDIQIRSINHRIEAKRDETQSLMKDIDHSAELKISPLDYPKHTLFSAKELSIRFGEKPIVTGLTFTVGTGEQIALCGKNGCGKSSLLKLLLGEGIPYHGELFRGSGLTISYLPQDCSHLSGMMRDFTDIHGIDESLFKTILRKLDFKREQFEKPMETCSMGQKKKIFLAKSLCEKAHLYLWDEPLNYIDVISRLQIEKLLLEFKPTLVFVEHDAVFTENIASKKITFS